MHSSVLAQMFGPGVAAATAAPTLVCSELFPDELRYIAGAIESRRAEFGTARVLARRSLATLGIEPCSLVPNSDRSPNWPPGVKGTIAHTANCCAAAVTNLPEILAIGLDLEEDTPLPQELESMICTWPERQWLDRFPKNERARLGKLYFSAKEAFYKCQYEISRTFIDFQDVTLELDIAAQTFRATALTRDDPLWSNIGHVIGRFRRNSSLLITTALLRASP